MVVGDAQGGGRLYSAYRLDKARTWLDGIGNGHPIRAVCATSDGRWATAATGECLHVLCTLFLQGGRLECAFMSYGYKLGRHLVKPCVLRLRPDLAAVEGEDWKFRDVQLPWVRVAPCCVVISGKQAAGWLLR